MVLEIPPPEVHGSSQFTWKATAEQKPWREGEPKVTIYNYEIFHDDGTKTLRTVTDTDGVKTIEEKKEAGAPVEKAKPIGPPQDLPSGATFDAKRVIFTDEKNQVTTTINYTIYLATAKYSQTEVHRPDGTEVTKGDLVPLDASPPKVTPPKEDIQQKKTFEPDASSEPTLPPPETSPRATWPPPQQQQKSEPATERRKIRSRGNVADRYLKNLA